MELSSKRPRMVIYEFDREPSKLNEYFIHPPLIIKYTRPESSDSDSDQDSVIEIPQNQNVQSSSGPGLQDSVKDSSPIVLPDLPRKIPPPPPKLSQLLQQETSLTFQCYIVRMGRYLVSAHRFWQKGFIELKISDKNDFAQIQINTPQFVDKVTNKTGKKFNLFFNLKSVAKMDIYCDFDYSHHKGGYGFFHLAFKMTREEIDIIRKHLRDEEEFPKSALKELVDSRTFKISLKNLTQAHIDLFEKILGKDKVEMIGELKDK